jgi:hypothetical protein
LAAKGLTSIVGLVSIQGRAVISIKTLSRKLWLNSKRVGRNPTKRLCWADQRQLLQPWHYQRAQVSSGGGAAHHPET